MTYFKKNLCLINILNTLTNFYSVFRIDLLEKGGFSPVENQNDLELDFKVFLC